MLHLMVIEDNEDDMNLLLEVNALLGREDIEVIRLHSGRGVLETIKEYQPFLLLLDINLPGKDGIEILKEIRSNKLVLPVCIMTTSKDKVDIKRAYGAGANAYLTKPFHIKELKEMLATVYDFWDMVQRCSTL